MSLISLSDLDIGSLKGITQDSRQAKDGYLFAALSGSKVDGSKFIDSAIEAGAFVILAGANEADRKNAKIIRSGNPRYDLSQIAAQFYAKQPEHIVAVTGTNGKTSVVTFIEQFWGVLGTKGKSLGTLSGAMTTPDPVSLHKTLADIAEQGTTHLAIEASSHGLDQYRLDGMKVRVAGFTNLSRDHLDYHETMENYLAAKTRLFSGVLEDGGVAVLNADIPEFVQIKSALQNRNIKVLSYGQNGAELKILSAQPTAHGLNVHVQILGKAYECAIPLVGEFQLMNLLCALGMVIAEDLENTARTESLVSSLSKIEGVRGRVQSIAGHPQGAGVYIDYAHTPDALETVLKALRPHVQGRLVCLYGCGGDRDPGKRPMMARTVLEFADIGILTDDNPRSEDPAEIRAQALKGAPEHVNIAGRREAIQYGVNMLEQGDVFVVAGKGHEQGQTFKDHIEPFDDAEEASRAIKNYKKEENEECKP